MRQGRAMKDGLFSFHSPPTPPTTREDDLAVLRLIRSRRVGPATFHRLIAEHGTASAALDALPALGAAAGLADYTPCPPGAAQAELAAGQRAGARLLRWDDPDYPADLARIDDAPPVLWVAGDLSCMTRPLVAVIGARSASALGLRMARGMAGALACAGVTVVAGLARGIDTAAHEASHAKGTVAVMAGGIDVIYPAENAGLARAITDRGCLITERPPGTAPVARHFPARNRIVSGLCRGVVVIEAAHRSGSLITARLALDQGRDVLAVPGHPIDARASGCNALIRDGATLVRNAEDVMAALGLEPATDRAAVASSVVHSAARGARPASRPRIAAGAGTARSGEQGAETHAAVPVRPHDADRKTAVPPARAAPRDAGGPVALEQRLLGLLGPSPTDENVLIRTLGVAAAVVAPVILSLELDGRITRLAGGRIALVV